MKTKRIIADNANVGLRLDVFLAAELDISRSMAQSAAEQGLVKINGHTALKNYKIKKDDIIEACLPEPKILQAEPQDIDIDIIYEDDSLIIVNKPQGMVVHPANGNPDGTLVNALMHHCGARLSTINGVVRPGIVHRLDKNTAGLLIVAKNDESHRSLAGQIAAHTFERKYEAVVIGNIREDSGVLDFPIGRSEKDRKKMTVTSKNSRNAMTLYNVIERYRGYTHIELILKTGRTHQIRVHMAHTGHPVLGDDVYGPKNNKFGLNGQCLFAKYIGFEHPVTGIFMEFEGRRPGFLENTLKKLIAEANL